MQRSLLLDRAAPSKGVNNVLTILVNYSDTTVTHAASDYRRLLFGTGNTSMADYYKEVSYGQLTLTEGPAGLRGWYRLTITRLQASRAWALPVYEAAKQADLEGVNFAPYDQNGDCIVDIVNVIHQGFGKEETGDPLDIWSHRGWLELAKGEVPGAYVTRTPCSKGGFIKIDDYVMQPEKQISGMTTVGVFAHEYGHALGLPDLYDIDYSSRGVGIWSGMAAGSWTGVSRLGDSPAHFDPWSKSRLGWLKPEKISNTALVTKTLRPANGFADVWQFGDGDALTRKGEYFLVENRQKSGFDSGLPAAGMMIWHIDEAVGSEEFNDANAYECAPVDPGSCKSRHYRVALVQADGGWDLERNRNRGDGGDVFPGTSRNVFFSDITTPNARLYSGLRSGISIGAIKIDGGGNAVANVSMGGKPQLPRPLRFSMAGPGRVSISYAGTGLECTASCTHSFPEGTVVTLNASPAPGFQFMGWSANKICTGTGACSLTISGPVRIMARFVPIRKFALSYVNAGKGSGSVSISPAGLGGAPICSGKCRNVYYAGTVVRVTAAPAPGSTFKGWSGTAGCTGTGACTITVDSAKKLVANFERRETVASR